MGLVIVLLTDVIILVIWGLSTVFICRKLKKGIFYVGILASIMFLLFFFRFSISSFIQFDYLCSYKSGPKIFKKIESESYILDGEYGKIPHNMGIRTAVRDVANNSFKFIEIKAIESSRLQRSSLWAFSRKDKHLDFYSKGFYRIFKGNIFKDQCISSDGEKGKITNINNFSLNDHIIDEGECVGYMAISKPRSDFSVIFFEENQIIGGISTYGMRVSRISTNEILGQFSIISRRMKAISILLLGNKTSRCPEWPDGIESFHLEIFQKQRG